MPIHQDVFHLSRFVVSSNLNLLGCASLEILASTICHKASLSIPTFHDTTTNCRSAIWKIWKTRVYRSRSPATSCGIVVFNFVGIPPKTFISIFLRFSLFKYNESIQFNTTLHTHTQHSSSINLIIDQVKRKKTTE